MASIAKKCLQMKVSYVVVKAAMLRWEMTFDEAVAYARSIGVNVGRKHYPSREQYYTAHKVSAGIVRARKLHDWDRRDVMKTPVRGTTGRKVKYKGVEYKSHSELCREYGISNHFIDRLTRDYGYDFLTWFAFTETYFRKFRPNKEPMSRCPYLIVNQKWFWTKSDFAIALGVTEGMLGVALYKYDYDIYKALAYLHELHGIPDKFLFADITLCYRQFYTMLNTLVDSGMMANWSAWHQD